MESLHSHNESPRAVTAGFTLIEMLVVLAIITIITTVAITGQSSFNKTLILSNTAYDIALTIRSAGMFGIGSRVGTATNVGYGIHLSSGTNTSFILFADTDPPGALNCHGLPSGDASTPDAQPGNCVYNDPIRDTLVQTYQLNNGMTISDFCALSSDGNPKWSCAQSQNQGNSYGNRISSLDIVFARPNAEPFIRMKEGGNNKISSATSACLVIASPSAPDGPYRYVSIISSGQIASSATPCRP